MRGRVQTTADAIGRAYARGARMQARHDPVFACATRLLPARVRPAVHALYGFLRAADELVDDPEPGTTPAQRVAALDALEADLAAGLRHGAAEDPVVGALVDAGRRHAMPLELLPAYLGSMRVDCGEQVRLRDRDELDAYMDGSAATVGRLMAPLLDVPPHRREAVARLGVGFQLTNFLRDAREDLALGRVYLPGLDVEALERGRRAPAPRGLVRRAARLLGAAEEVCSLAPPRMRPGILAATTVYRGTLVRVARRGVG